MKYIRNTTDFYIEENTVLSLGKFDGIHRGHEQLLQYFAKKKDEGLAGAIFTFDIPPRRNVQNVEAKVLTTNEEKRHMFERLGIDYVVECPFTQEIMCMEPEDFIAKIVRQLHVKCMVVGEDFHFGHNRRGDYHMLRPASARLRPPNGVYVTEACGGDRGYRGISNVGCKPTIEGEYPVGVETHLLDFAEDVYDKMVTVEFLGRVRSEQKFASIEALKEQMQNDVAYGRAYFEKNTSQ